MTQYLHVDRVRLVITETWENRNVLERALNLADNLFECVVVARDARVPDGVVHKIPGHVHVVNVLRSNSELDICHSLTSSHC